MKCSAYFSDMSRCSNIRIGDSYHCELHRDKAKNLYLKYKSSCTECEKIDTNDYQVKDYDVNRQISKIMDYYILYNRAFSAREKHRKYYFVSDYHDSGHNYQFTKLNDYILKCEDILTKLYSMRKEVTDEIKDEVINETKAIEDNKLYDKRINFTIEDFKQQRQQLEANYQKCLSLYTIENNTYMKEKELLIKNISICLGKLFCPENKETSTKYLFYKENDYYFTCIQSFKDLTIELISTLIFELMIQLIKINFFDTSFIKVKNDVFKITLKIEKYTDCHLINYLSQFSIIKLKEIYSKLLLNNNKIETLIGPLIKQLINIFCGNEGYRSRLMYYLIPNFGNPFLLPGEDKTDTNGRNKISYMKYKDFGDTKIVYSNK